MPGTVDGVKSCFDASSMATQTAHIQQPVQGCTRGRSAWGENCLSVRQHKITVNLPQQGANSVEGLAEACLAGCARIKIQHRIRQATKQPSQTKHWFAHGKRAPTLPPASLQLQASLPELSYLSKHSCPTFTRAIRLQQRCNPDSQMNVHTLLFHRICNLARPMETPLCRMVFLFLHSLWLYNHGETIIYSK